MSKIILASSSIYRQELLKRLPIRFTSTSPNINEVRMNDEDLLTTNLFQSSSNMQSNYEKFRKKRSKPRLRNVAMNPNKFNVLESEMKKDSLMLKQKQKVDNRQVKKKLKKTIKYLTNHIQPKTF